ncbi:unnamed protein product [Medioppia subpectinata]|uniref:CUB domain-containing protein n=1 Tax=Medioppia subpectinata TaxID=1979941 RepID=A0A7R9PZD8_9ACAR|nr:unnamed protein product [Medioppia subpectinata]CAG2106984.1 unnamed protein product [Medioppia subpectinata]
MDSYCSASVPANGKTPANSGTAAVIQLGKESCTSVATLRAFKTEYPNNAKCEVTVKSPPGFGLVATLKYASLRPTLPCAIDKDEVIVSINKTLQYNIISSTGEGFVTDISDTDIGVKFVTTNMRDAIDGKGFEIHFTAYRLMESSASVPANGKTPANSGTVAVIQLGKESCTSVATLRAFKTEYPNNAKCEVTVKSPPGFGLVATLKYASLRPTLPCAIDKDEVIVSLNKTLQYNISSSTGEGFVTDISDTDIGVKFVTTNMRDAIDGKGFEIHFTAYRLKESSGVCSDGYFDCDNSRCVHNGLKCDRIDNCGNNRDEDGCDYPDTDMLLSQIFVNSHYSYSTVV